MIEPFCSEYTKSYRQHDREPEIEKTKPCIYYKDLGENFLPIHDSKTIYNPERDEALIKELHLKTLISTYQASYCSTVGTKSLEIDPNDLEADQFVAYFNRYYSPKTQPVLTPLETSRKINGYCRFSRYYTGKSEFEETISRAGYAYFKRDYDLGKSRLFRKKQKALEKLNEGKEPLKENSNQEKKEGEEAERGDPDAEKNESDKCDENKIREKVCLFCCEKFGNFSYGSKKNSIEEKTENLNEKPKN